METLIDDPSNGFMLQHDVHVNFDKLKWYLVPKPEVSLYRFQRFISYYCHYRVTTSTRSKRFGVDPGWRLSTSARVSNSRIVLPLRKTGL